MHRITLILILFLLLPDMYIYLVYIVKKTRNIVWRSTYWLPTAMLVAIYMYYIYMTGDNALSHHPQGIGRLAVAVMLFAVWYASTYWFVALSYVPVTFSGYC